MQCYFRRDHVKLEDGFHTLRIKVGVMQAIDPFVARRSSDHFSLSYTICVIASATIEQ